jgi:ubiquinone biosynthesis UbiH/UbiF/VisC/COQ6 family hydroxylase
VTGSFDVLVVGGGLVGATAALAIADRGLDVGLVDRTRPEPSRGAFGMDIRNIACSPASKALLGETGVWSELAPVPYSRMEVWEERGSAALEFTAEEAGRSELGWILENSPTVCALWERIERHPRLTIRLGEVRGVSLQADEAKVDLTDGALRAGLIVGVDGARSAVRHLAGAELDVLATGQRALATIVRTECPHEGTALQRFLLDGPLALLPSRDGRASSVVWSQSPEQAERRLALSDEAFCAEVEVAIESRLGRVLEVDRRFVFPLAQHVVRDFNPHDRLLLIGDAARVLHPLAGLGANVGFEDVRDLLAVLDRLPAGADTGRPGIWRTFARRRRVRARLMIAAMAGFRQVYADGSPTFTWLRNSAVNRINRSAVIKRQVIREALGLGPLASAW